MAGGDYQGLALDDVEAERRGGPAASISSRPEDPASTRCDEGSDEVYLLKVVSSQPLPGAAGQAQQHRASGDVSANAGPSGGERRLVASSVSDFTVRVYELGTIGAGYGAPQAGSAFSPVCRIRGHRGPVTDLLFFPSTPSVLMTASEDGSIKTWDLGPCLKGSGEAACVNSLVCDGRQSPVWSISASNSGELLAAATPHGVLVWIRTLDKRGGLKWKKLLALEESFCDVVTQVLFHPHHSARYVRQQNSSQAQPPAAGRGKLEPLVLAACGEDGLVCLFDLNGGSDEDDNLLCVLNAESAIAQMGFFGPHGQEGGGGTYLWCRTNDEAFRAWNWAEACDNDGDVAMESEGEGGGGNAQVYLLRDARKALTEKLQRNGHGAMAGGGGRRVDYLVDCHWDAARAELRLVGGASSGEVHFFRLAVEGISFADPASGGSRPNSVRFLAPTDVRSCLCLRHSHGAIVRSLEASNAPAWYLTCGEDGRLCVWSPREHSGGGYGRDYGKSSGRVNGARFKPY